MLPNTLPPGSARKRTCCSSADHLAGPPFPISENGVSRKRLSTTINYLFLLLIHNACGISIEFRIQIVRTDGRLGSVGDIRKGGRATHDSRHIALTDGSGGRPHILREAGRGQATDGRRGICDRQEGNFDPSHD